MSEKVIRNIFYYKNFYLNFFDALKPEVKKKLNEIDLAEQLKKEYFDEKGKQ